MEGFNISGREKMIWIKGNKKRLILK